MTDKFLVSVSRCSSYEADEVYNALAGALEMIGGWPKTNMPNELLFKTNLLAPKPPDKAVTTHPSVVRALIKLVRNSGFSGKITVADSQDIFMQTKRRAFKANWYVGCCKRRWQRCRYNLIGRWLRDTQTTF